MRLFLTMAAAFFAIASIANAQASERVITVTGSATVFVKPDVVRVHYGVKVTEPSADAVKDVLAKTVTAMDAVKKLKLTNVKVTSAPVAMKQGSTNPNGAQAFAPGGAAPAAPMPGLGPFTGVTSHTATLTDADPDKLKAAVDSFVKAIVEAGANTSGGEEKEQNLEFVFPGRGQSDGPKIVVSRADDSAGRDEALQKAVEKAVRNAKAIAKGLGATEVKVISVTDDPEKPAAEPATISIYGGEPANAHRPNAGEVEVKVRVIVKCSY